MRIAFFVGGFPLVSETFIVRQITGLLDLGHEVDIFAETRPESQPVHPEVAAYGLLARTTYMEMPEEAGYWEMPVCPLTGRTWPPGASTSILNAARVFRAIPQLLCGLARDPRVTLRVLDPKEYGYQARSLSALYRLARVSTRGRNYDVLHAHFGPVGNTFRFARQLFRAPLVVSFHGYDFCTWPRKHGCAVYRQLFNTADAVTVNSHYTGLRLRELGCPAAKMHCLAVGLNPDDFPFHVRSLHPGDSVHLLSVGRLVEKKGLEYAVRALARVRESYPGIRYEIIGDGPLRSQLEALVREFRLESIIALAGAQDGTYVRQRMAKAHLFIMPSVTAADGDQEGQGLVLQEAQASGLPVVATEHGPFPEGLLPERSGFLVPERNVESLAERIKFLAEHPDLWAEMGHQGRRYVEGKYDIRNLNRQLVKMYEGVAEEHKHLRLTGRRGFANGSERFEVHETH